MNRSSLIFAAALLYPVAAAATARAQVSLLFDDFDSYADTAAFNAVWPVVGTQPTGQISQTQAVSLPNSVLIQAPANPTAMRNQRTFAESGVPTASNPIEFRFSFFETNSAVGPYRQYANLQDGVSPTSTGQLISMGLNNNVASTFYMARILGVDGGTGTSAYFLLNDAGAPNRSNGWHDLRAVLSPTDAQFYVDGILSRTIATTAFSTRSYDVVRIGAGVSSTQDAFYDNMSVATLAPVPEPTSLALAGIGLAGIWIRRRRAA